MIPFELEDVDFVSRVEIIAPWVSHFFRLEEFADVVVDNL